MSVLFPLDHYKDTTTKANSFECDHFNTEMFPMQKQDSNPRCINRGDPVT